MESSANRKRANDFPTPINIKFFSRSEGESVGSPILKVRGELGARKSVTKVHCAKLVVARVMIDRIEYKVKVVP